MTKDIYIQVYRHRVKFLKFEECRMKSLPVACLLHIFSPSINCINNSNDCQNLMTYAASVYSFIAPLCVRPFVTPCRNTKI